MVLLPRSTLDHTTASPHPTGTREDVLVLRMERTPTKATKGPARAGHSVTPNQHVPFCQPSTESQWTLWKGEQMDPAKRVPNRTLCPRPHVKTALNRTDTIQIPKHNGEHWIALKAQLRDNPSPRDIYFSLNVLSKKKPLAKATGTFQ